jgi:hypothetical protein
VKIKKKNLCKEKRLNALKKNPAETEKKICAAKILYPPSQDF